MKLFIQNNMVGITMESIPDGWYNLGLAPVDDKNAELLFRFFIENGKITQNICNINIDWCTTIEFIIRSSQCSLNNIKPGYKYLLLSED